MIDIRIDNLSILFKIEINEILTALSLFRFYYLFRYLLCLNEFYCARANRVSKMFGMYLSISYNIKCVFIKNPFSSILIVTVLVLTKFSYILKVTEGPFYDKIPFYKLNYIDYRYFTTCAWEVFVAITTGIII